MKKTISLMLAFVMLLSITAGIDYSIYAKELPSSGYCGLNQNITYTFDNETGLLIISGRGSMKDYSNFHDSPFSKTNIVELIVEDGVTWISSCAFEYCQKLERVTIGNSVVSIGGSSFLGCSNLKELCLPCSTKVYRAFSSCNIETIVLTKGTGEMVDYKYDQHGNSIESCYNYQCTPWYISRDSLKQLVIEDGVTRIGDRAFEGCSGLTSVTIPDSVTSIGNRAFEGCTGLTSIILPNSVIELDSHAFENCNNLISARLSNSMSVIYNNTFAGCSNFKSIEIPDSIRLISDCAFSNCSALKSVILPNSITDIGNGVFENCTDLRSVTFPVSIIYIGSDAFLGCTSLSEVHYSGKEEQWSTITIKDGNDALKNVPIIFSDASGWRSFAGKWYYYDSNGTPAKGWKNINNDWYYFDSTGVMQTGWQTINSKVYYLGASGIMQTGWQVINNNKYYFNSNGIMQTGWQKLSGNWYYFDNSGAMCTGRKCINNKWYDLGTTGVMVIGWDSGKNYYYNSDGSLKIGWVYGYHGDPEARVYVGKNSGVIEIKPTGNGFVMIDGVGTVTLDWYTIKLYPSEISDLSSRSFWKQYDGEWFYF